MSASPEFPALPADWSEETGFLPDQNPTLFFRFFVKKSPVAKKTGRALFIVHGIGEQSDRFTHFPHYLHTCVDAIGLIDLPGHGRSTGLRGHIENFDVYSQSVIRGFEYFSKKTQPSLGPLEFHWLGCSMGGLISARTMVHFPILPLTSVTLAEPQFGIAIKIPWIKEFFGSLLEPVIGKIPLKNEIDVHLLSHDESVQKTYRENPLNHPFASPRLYVNMKKEMAAMAKLTSEFPFNLFLIVPLADQIVDWKATYHFFDEVKMKTGMIKTMTSFPDFNHEAFNEIEKDRVFLALENWILKISKLKPPAKV
jgi:alpha-beta hydrolase superfamily lysophospholipase